MLSVFFNGTGQYIIGWLPEGETRNSPYHVEQVLTPLADSCYPRGPKRPDISSPFISITHRYTTHIWWPNIWRGADPVHISYSTRFRLIYGCCRSFLTMILSVANECLIKVRPIAWIWCSCSETEYSRERHHEAGAFHGHFSFRGHATSVHLQERHFREGYVGSRPTLRTARSELR
jgi:hypothetical protein